MIPHATSNNVGANLVGDGTQLKIPPHTVDVPLMGKVTFFHADGINIATISIDDGDERLAIQLAKEACDCGCGRPAYGMIVTPPADHARALGEKLIEMADSMTASAASLATAAIAKARGK